LLWVVTAFFEPGTQSLQRPVDHRVGGVVEHLTDYFAPDAGIGAAFYLHDGWDRILVEEQMIHSLSSGASLLGGQRYFTI